MSGQQGHRVGIESNGVLVSGTDNQWIVPAGLRARLAGLVARYTLASAVALAADTGSFLAMLHAGVPPVTAAAIGFILGIAVHWLVSSRVFFVEDVAADARDRGRQRTQFIAVSLIGLALTTVIVGVAAHLGINPRFAKLVAVVVSFVTTSGLRHIFVFRQPALA